ncbi:transporter substrate-binding domain-containing protein [Kingella negevensis]|nr:transporter substrate-binding domain-containing protein [Kingella negevensis]
MKKGNTELLKKLDGGLEKIKADGTLDKIIEKWFGKQN